jgi:hypothetical protein
VKKYVMRTKVSQQKSVVILRKKVATKDGKLDEMHYYEHALWHQAVSHCDHG